MSAVRLAFRPDTHGFHFGNRYRHRGRLLGQEFRTEGLCGGLCLAALNFMRFGLPIPPFVDAEMQFEPTSDASIRLSAVLPSGDLNNWL